MTMHSLTKSAIFFAVGHIAQVKGTQKIADMGGLTETHPVLGWGLVLGVVAIAGMPPLGIFMSEFLIVSSTFAREPWLAVPLVFGLLVGFGALILRLNQVAFGEPRGPSAPARSILCADVCASRAGVHGRHLSAAAAGRLVPERREGSRVAHGACIDTIPHLSKAEAHRPWPRAIVDEAAWTRHRARSRGRPLDLGQPVGGSRRRAHGAVRREDGRRRGRHLRVPPRALSLGRRGSPAGDPASSARSAISMGSSRKGCGTCARGSISAPGT